MADKVRIKELLHGPLVSVEPNTTVVDAVLRMNKSKVGATLVVGSDGMIQGIFTERDVLTKVIANQLDIKTTLISRVMTGNVLTINQNETVDKALLIMNDRHIRNLPVVDDTQRPVGILSILDAIQAAMQSLVDGIISAQSK